ncbi:hypothetical protein LCGC14_1588850 [marine sediment metagenome]|uniref:Uncharacterized protein n=1 Tax=marine sediment metagenome TaxID=412755 RepID=A0A0F9J0X3_9ZZZZ
MKEFNNSNEALEYLKGPNDAKEIIILDERDKRFVEAHGKTKIIVMRYVCAMCNYEFVKKEGAVNCCGGSD